MSDNSNFLGIIDRLVNSGNKIIRYEHNQGVIKNFDWTIVMDPERGKKGGKVIFEGKSKGLLSAKKFANQRLCGVEYVDLPDYFESTFPSELAFAETDLIIESTQK